LESRNVNLETEIKQVMRVADEEARGRAVRSNARHTATTTDQAKLL